MQFNGCLVDNRSIHGKQTEQKTLYVSSNPDPKARANRNIGSFNPKLITTRSEEMKTRRDKAPGRARWGMGASEGYIQ